MTVLTNKRAYNFVLSAHWPGTKPHPDRHSMFFQVNFRYPQAEAAQALAQAKALELKQRLNNKEDKPVAINWNYWVQGSDRVSPSRAFDDGRFTYLTFPNNREMPAVYIENPEGEESLVNTNVNGDTIVVHKIAQTLVLRKGKAVAGIVNKSYDPDGIANLTGTVSPQVKRVLKGAE
jgi:type IV secretion system protein VirB9